MIKLFLMACGIVFLLHSSASAQLAADPWANKSALQDKMDRAKAKSTPSIKANNNIYSGNMMNIPTPDYIGTNTTYTTARGQEMIAPDVNITNMLLMTQHLRNLGYKIPDGLDELINTAPARLKREILKSMIMLENSSNPVAVASVSFAEIFEKNTGFDIENLITNSLRIIDSRR